MKERVPCRDIESLEDPRILDQSPSFLDAMPHLGEEDEGKREKKKRKKEKYLLRLQMGDEKKSWERENKKSEEGEQ